MAVFSFPPIFFFIFLCVFFCRLCHHHSNCWYGIQQQGADNGVNSRVNEQFLRRALR